MRRADKIRRSTSAIMTTLTAFCTIAAVGILLVIITYIAMQGVASLSVTFLIDSPKPVGEGGGIGNAIVGSLVLLLLGSLLMVRVNTMGAFTIFTPFKRVLFIIEQASTLRVPQAR